MILLISPSQLQIVNRKRVYPLLFSWVCVNFPDILVLPSKKKIVRRTRHNFMCVGKVMTISSCRTGSRQLPAVTAGEENAVTVSLIYLNVKKPCWPSFFRSSKHIFFWLDKQNSRISMFSRYLFKSFLYSSSALLSLWANHMPRIGHWNKSIQEKKDAAEFLCLK